MREIRFIIGVFGDNYIGLLLSNLYSIYLTHPSSRVTVFWEGIDLEKMKIFKIVFPQMEFLQTDYGFSGNRAKRIGSKTILWEQAARKYKDENLCFVDADTVIIQDITKFFQAEDFDVVYTYKDAQFPLNTGVILSRGGDRAVSFFSRWKEDTLKIINDDKLLKQALDNNMCYGAADQMSLYQMLGYKKANYNTVYRIDISGVTVQFKGISCQILNETNSTKITPDTHVIHYKGGWQPILLEGANFTKNRPKNASWEMYIYFLKNYEEAVGYVNKRLNTQHQLEFFKIEVPFYLNRSTFRQNRILYVLFYMMKVWQHIFLVFFK